MPPCARSAVYFNFKLRAELQASSLSDLSAGWVLVFTLPSVWCGTGSKLVQSLSSVRRNRNIANVYKIDFWKQFSQDPTAFSSSVWSVWCRPRRRDPLKGRMLVAATTSTLILAPGYHVELTRGSEGDKGALFWGSNAHCSPIYLQHLLYYLWSGKMRENFDN